MVKNVSEVMLTSLPNFWRIARGFLEGKLKKVNTPFRMRSSSLTSRAESEHRRRRTAQSLAVSRDGSGHRETVHLTSL